MRIVAFAGLARAGKTTAAEMFADWCTRHGLNPVRMSFAEDLKKAAAYLRISKETQPKLYRELLQKWGSNKRNPDYQPGRSGPNYWVSRTATNMVRQAHDEKMEYIRHYSLGTEDEWRERVVILDDLRYINELNLMASIDGVTVFVDGLERITDLKAEWRAHESEALATLYTLNQIDEDVFDFLLPNAGGKEELQAKIDKLAPIWLDHTFTCPCCGMED